MELKWGPVRTRLGLPTSAAGAAVYYLQCVAGVVRPGGAYFHRRVV